MELGNTIDGIRTHNGKVGGVVLGGRGAKGTNGRG